MKPLLIIVIGLGVLATPIKAQTKPSLNNQKDKVSYSIGVDIGTKIKQQDLDLNPEALAAGLRDALTGAKIALTEQEMEQVLTAYGNEMRTKHTEKAKVEGEKNRKEGESFLAENKKKQGVKTLPSGLQYKIITEGKGKKPKATDTVTTHYRGTLIDGTEFDSSYKRGEPATFPVDGVIKGWTEALQLMPVGSKWQLFVPAELAYGEREVGPEIPPNSTLVFEVQLLGVEEPASKKNE
jgi:FKBP-type peptidyl-prolyl cis-trans isomerase FklB